MGRSRERPFFLRRGALLDRAIARRAQSERKAELPAAG